MGSLDGQTLLAQYEIVRSDMRAHSQQIATLDQIYFAAVVAVLGFAFANPETHWGLFLLVPYLTFMFYMYGQGFYHRMSLLRRYLDEELLPALSKISETSIDLNFDRFVEDKSAVWNRPRFQFVEWGLFVAPPGIALWQAAKHADETITWVAWACGVALVLLVGIIGVVMVWNVPLHAVIPARLRRLTPR